MSDPTPVNFMVKRVTDSIVLMFLMKLGDLDATTSLHLTEEEAAVLLTKLDGALCEAPRA